MRKPILLLATMAISLAMIIISTIPSTVSTSAKVEYMRVITEDTPFYSDSGGTNLLFYLPYTYYVKILEQSEIYSHVECYGTESSIAIDGYVPTGMLFSDGLPVQRPYLEKVVSTITTAVLYSDKNLSVPLQYVFAYRTLKYYGQITATDGSVLFYVGYNNKLGYVEESAISPFEISLHPNELTFITPELPSEDELNPDTNSDVSTDSSPIDNLTTIRIVVIACLLLAGIIALVLSLKNKPKRQYNNYYDENEYE